MKKKLTPFFLIIFAFMACINVAQAQYCGGATGTGLYVNSCNAGFITNVSILSTTLNNTSACSGVSFTSYNTGQATASIQQGATYTLSVTTNTTSIIAAWIDFDRNNTFDPSEFIEVTTSSDTLVPALKSFNVPLNASAGLTGMRIRTRTSGNPNGPNDACTAGFLSGEGEQYTITIAPAPPCNAVPNAGVAESSDDSVCINNTFTLSLIGADVASGLTYEWQSSPNNVTWTALPFGTNSTYTTQQFSTTYYRCLLRCNGGAPSASVAKKVDMVTTVFYDFNGGTIYTEDFDNWMDGCDNHDIPSENWENTPSSGNISWRRQDEGYTTGGWTFQSGFIPPHQGPGCAAFHTPASPNLSVYDGKLDLHLNCINFSTVDLTFWYYKVCCTAGFDSISIYLSTNGGFTFGPALAHFTNDTLYPGPSIWKLRGVANIPVNNSPTVVIRIRDSGDLAGTEDTGIDDVKIDGILGRTNPAFDLTNIAVLPNPSNGRVEIRCSNLSFLKSSLQLMDLTGRVVYTASMENTNNYWSQSFDWSAMPKGIYLLKLISDQKVYTQKVVLE